MAGGLRTTAPLAGLVAGGRLGLYGTSWGVPLGLAFGGRSAPGPAVAQGAGFGLAVWGASLVELPLLGLAPPFWRTAPGDLGRDAGLHLVPGLVAGMALRALRRG